MRKRRDIRAYRCKIYACRILQSLVSRGLTIGISWILYNKCIIDSLCSTIHHNILWMEYIHIKDSKSYCIIFSNDFGTKTYCLPKSPKVSRFAVTRSIGRTDWRASITTVNACTLSVFTDLFKTRWIHFLSQYLEQILSWRFQCLS